MKINNGPENTEQHQTTKGVDANERKINSCKDRGRKKKKKKKGENYLYNARTIGVELLSDISQTVQ